MKVKSVQRLPKDKQEIVPPPGKPIPLKTKSGLQIGAFYTPPAINRMTKEDEFWQGILLGIEPFYSRRRVAYMATYVGTLFLLMFCISLVKD